MQNATVHTVIEIFKNIREEVVLVGLHINEDKVEYMHI
jgi:hypothetical protein